MVTTDLPSNPTAQRFHVRLAGLTLAVVAWLAMLGARSLISSDEGRYASLSLAMLQSGDWITPRLNGLLYFEKPPLQYWAGAVAMAVFGVNEWAGRLWPGLCGLATVGLLGVAARRLWGPRAGWHALIVGGSTTWIVVNSQFLSLDAGLTAMLTLSLCGWLLGLSPALDDARRRRWRVAAWVGMALAVLSKGLVGLLIPVAALLLRALWERDASFLRVVPWRRGLLILGLVAAPWFVVILLREPDFARFFFIHEHVERFLTPVHRREGTWWMFVPVLLVGLLPWTAALPSLLRARDSEERFLLAWAGFVFVFFSLSSSKLPSYVLPMFPPLVLLFVRRMATMGAPLLSRRLLLPAAVWATALVATPFATRWSQAPAVAVEALARGTAIAAIVFLLAFIVARAWLRRDRIDEAVALVAAAHLAAVFIVIASHETYGRLKSAASIAAALAPEGVDRDTPVFALRLYDHTLPFYLRRNVTLVEIVDEFEFGERAEPERWIPTLDAFAERWRALPRGVVYLSRATLKSLQANGFAGRVVFEDARRVVVVKP